MFGALHAVLFSLHSVLRAKSSGLDGMRPNSLAAVIPLPWAISALPRAVITLLRADTTLPRAVVTLLRAVVTLLRAWGPRTPTPSAVRDPG